jgi:hypothetical protein
MSEIQFSVLDQLDQLEEIVLEGSRIPLVVEGWSTSRMPLRSWMA